MTQNLFHNMYEIHVTFAFDKKLFKNGQKYNTMKIVKCFTCVYFKNKHVRQKKRSQEKT